MKYALIYSVFDDPEDFSTPQSSKAFAIMNRPWNSAEEMACVEDPVPSGVPSFRIVPILHVKFKIIALASEYRG